MTGKSGKRGKGEGRGKERQSGRRDPGLKMEKLKEADNAKREERKSLLLSRNIYLSIYIVPNHKTTPKQTHFHFL